MSITREVTTYPGLVCDHYPTMRAAWEVRPAPVNQENWEQYKLRDHSSEVSWWGTDKPDNPGEALVMLEAGKTDEVLNRVRNYHAQLTTSGMATRKVRQPVPRRVRSRGDSGNELDENLARIGRYDIAWSRAVRRPVVHGLRRAVLAVGVCANSNLDARNLDWRAATAWIIYEKLVAAGYAVEVIAYSIETQLFSNSSVVYEATYVAKSFIMPLSAEQLAVTCSAMFLRSVIFLGRFATSQDKLHTNYHLGYPVHNKLPRRILDMQEAGALVLDVPSGTQSQSAAQHAINTAMGKLVERGVKAA